MQALGCLGVPLELALELAGDIARNAAPLPVVGIDLVVTSPRSPDYAFIEANERPGLANHEPQPTAERFVDLLFPLSVPASVRQTLQKKEKEREGTR